MRGCPWQCRFCQSTVIKRPLRYRPVESIVEAALEAYRNTGYDEISLLSLSTSDYPQFEELVRRMSEVFSPLGVKISQVRLEDLDQVVPFDGRWSPHFSLEPSADIPSLLLNHPPCVASTISSSIWAR